MTRTVLLTLLIAALTGCGSGPTPAGAPSATSGATATGTTTETDEDKAETDLVCADRAITKPVPASFPADFPLPENSTITGGEQRSGDQTVVTAVVRQDFKTLLAYMQTRLPAAGLIPSEGEVEEHDAESNFTGPNYRGRWQLRVIPDCPDQTQLTILTAPK
jgi:hypothetical protein